MMWRVSWSEFTRRVKPRSWLRDGLQRLRLGAPRIVEATAAATIAWFLAAEVFRHPQPFLAPVAALITVGLTRGQRVQRAIEIVIGVAAGILVADLIARAIGPGTFWSIALVTALALVSVVFIGGGPIATTQAAVSAIYVAVVIPPGSGLEGSRFVDALIGGAVALAVVQLPLDPDPLASSIRDARPLVDELATVLGETATALENHDVAAAERALSHARNTDPVVAAFDAAVEDGTHAAWLDPLRRRRMESVRVYERAARELDLGMRDVRGIARAAVVLTRSESRAPSPLVQALDSLARAVRGFGEHLSNVRRVTPTPRGRRADQSDTAPRDADAGQVVRDNALQAVRLAARALEQSHTLPVIMIVGQVRAAAVDLLRGLGTDLRQVLQDTEEALGMSSGDEI
jgi:uncharacterized membrane protein YgaE (UPF0421/DUF939 family)